LEGAERLALELGGRIQARLGNDVDALDATAGDDLDWRARVEPRASTACIPPKM